MGDYHRTTRECIVSQLRPELRHALQKYVDEHQLGDIEAEILICCETVSERKCRGRLLAWLNRGADSTIYMGTLLTPEWLIWVRSGDRSGVSLSAAKLLDIRIKPYTSVLTRDVGLEIIGYVGDTQRRVQGYIGLGPEHAGEKFCAAVQEAIAKVKPPSKERLFGWPTGH